MITLRPLSRQDIPFGLHLKSIAGWNQLATDWEVLLSMSAGGSYLASWQGRPAGTVTTIQYDDQFSWIGMVLVDPKFRGLGIGTHLLQAAIDYARPMGPVLLDATPKGRKLYLTLGFTDICSLERLEIESLQIPIGPSDPNILPITEERLAACIEFDALHFGLRREMLLRAFQGNAPEYGYVYIQNQQVKGFCLGRHGSRFEQIGPLVATNEPMARALFLTVTRSIRKPIIMDIMSEQTAWRTFLLELGFSVQRPFTRMSLGQWNAQQDRSGQFAIAGPEFG